jgi:RNA polymerase sigma-70 factor, ECF subfamily
VPLKSTTRLLGTSAGSRGAEGDPPSAAPAEEQGAEEEILATIDRGEPHGALTLMMRAFGAEVHRYCADLTGDVAAADDLLQVIFIQAFRDLAAFRRESSLRTWLYGIARHRCLDEIRRRSRWSKVFVWASDNTEAEPAREQDLNRESSARRELERCLETLRPTARECVLLRFRRELSYDEIAELTGLRAGTLRVQALRALSVLRRCLEKKQVRL